MPLEHSLCSFQVPVASHSCPYDPTCWQHSLCSQALISNPLGLLSISQMRHLLRTLMPTLFALISHPKLHNISFNSIITCAPPNMSHGSYHINLMHPLHAALFSNWTVCAQAMSLWHRFRLLHASWIMIPLVITCLQYPLFGLAAPVEKHPITPG